ncbi:MAG: recombinase RecT [Atopobiaceae bacterium]|nr:recombinase RecT [Atopobiaceae bacterium]
MSEGLGMVLASELNRPSVLEALPSNFNRARFIQNTVALVQSNEELSRMPHAKLVPALMKGAYLGLDFFNGECYAIPYGQQIQFMPSYKGMVKLAKSFSKRPLTDIYAHVVRDGDEFESGMDGGQEYVRFKPKTFSDAPIIGAFAVAQYVDGGIKVETMSKSQLDAAKRVSKAQSGTAWKFFPEEMYRKGLDVTTPIPTPSGFKQMLDIQIGDVVYDMYGHKTNVVDMSEVKQIDCYEVTFSGGDKLICDNEHLWVAKVGSNAHKQKWETYTVNQLADFKNDGKSVVVPVTGCVDFDEQDLLIPPYILGYWLGNGSSRAANVSCDERDLDEICSLMVAHSDGKYDIGKKRYCENSHGAVVGITHGFLNDLRELFVFQNKHIPLQYLISSREQRLDLLRGLMDSDGTITKNRGRAIYSSVRKNLAVGVYQIVSSLGEKAIISKRTQTGFGKEVECYYVSWQPTYCPVYLNRKVALMRDRKLSTYRSIVSINKVDSVPTKCLAVDSESKTYLAGDAFIPTHNCVIRRLCKGIDLSMDNAEQTRIMQDDDAIEAEVTEVDNPFGD